MRRIFAELLPPDRLMAPAILRLLDRFGLQTLVALPPSSQTPQMAEALARLGRVGAGVGIWPLLDDADGYWPSDVNASRFVDRAEDALQFARAAGVAVRTVVVDLEPPLEVMRALLGGGTSGHAGALAGRVRASCQTGEAGRRRASTLEFARLRRRLEDDGIEAFATVIPPVVLDHPAGAGVWQAVFQTPALRPRWSKVCPMLYTSVMRSLLPSKSDASARGLAYALARVTVARTGPRAAAALGLAGPGKLADEPVMDDVETLARDVGAIRAAGIDDLALFSLEGVLERETPEAWLRAFTSTESRRPSRRTRWGWRLSLMWVQVPSNMTRILKERV